ncbi:MAG: ABC transporter ATP-binding protein [Rhodospirillales bacterium]|nr:ABC transporter ATP-binding protein [Rhodospirillales bacterium]
MLEVDNVSVNYGAVRAVHSVSLSVDEGEIVTLLGPNGAGKTSMLSAIIGLVPVAEGTVTFEGQNINRLDTESRVARGITVTPEGRHVFANLTVEENLILGAAIRRDADGVARDLETYLDMFPILRERFKQSGGSLSGGEQQMLAVVRALMSGPKLLMLDEPSLGLAPQIVDQIFKLISGLRDHGLTLLVVEQNAQEALKFADRAYILSSGNLEFAGTAEELRTSADLMKAYIGEGVS